MSALTEKFRVARDLSNPAVLESSTETLPVIFVVSQSDNRANGGVKSITQVIEGLRRLRPIVVTQAETAATERWRDLGCEVHIWNFGAADVRTRSALQANRRMFRLIRSRRCQLVHCNDISALWNTGFGARMAGAKVIFNVRNIKPPEQRYGWRWRLARRISDRQLVLSREMQTEFARRVSKADHDSHVDYIYSAVDLVEFSPVGDLTRGKLRAQLGIKSDRFAIGYVAPFTPRKAQLEFIKQAAVLLKHSAPHAHVYFLGDFVPGQDDYARRCREAVAELGLTESITFVGFTADMADWYRGLDLLVVASRNEGLARCMIESLACGTPVVSFDVCSAREVLENHNCGVAVRQGDYPQLVQAITKLAHDHDLRQRFGAAAVAAAHELFDSQRIVARYEELYLSSITN